MALLLTDAAVRRGHRPAPARHARAWRSGRRDRRHLPLAPGPNRDRLLFPGGIERREVVRIRVGLCQQRVDDRRAWRLAGGERHQRIEHRLVGRLALAQPLGRAPRECAPVWPSSSRASASGSVDRNSRNSGRKSGSSLAAIDQAGLLVHRLEIDHRLAAVAAFAMHVLEQMQRQRARAVEQQDVALLQIVEIAGRDFLDQQIERDARPAPAPALRRPAPQQISAPPRCSSAVG